MISVERITRDDGKPYLDRLILFKNKYLGIFLHVFRDSDDDCLHNHPWDFLSLILTSGYYEHHLTPDTVRADFYIDPKSNIGPITRTRYNPGQILYRPARTVHRIELIPGTNPCTLVVHGTKFLEWGFHTIYGFIHHLLYSHKDHCE